MKFTFNSDIWEHFSQPLVQRLCVYKASPDALKDSNCVSDCIQIIVSVGILQGLTFYLSAALKYLQLPAP